MTVLLVDSDKKALDREAARLANQQSAAIVFLNSSADDTIKFAMHHSVDIVFTRSVLADMSGEELIKKICWFCPQAECHILLKDEEIPLFPILEKKGTLVVKKQYAEDTINYSEDDLHNVNNQPSADYLLCLMSKRGGKHMTEQELRSLGRKELLEMLIEQGKELEFLKAEYEKDLEFLKAEHVKETDALKKELEEAKKAVQNREIAINNAGSIAVAALQINGIFEAAQAASQQYIENIRSLNARQDDLCAQRDADSKAEADRRIKEASEKCEAMETACREKCIAMEANAKMRSEAYWEDVSKRLQSFYENHQELKKLLNFGAPGVQI